MGLKKNDIYELTKEHVSIEAVLAKHRTNVHVAIIIKRNKVLAVASNTIGSRSRGCGYEERTIHAERAVLKKLGDTAKLQGAIMVVVRIARGTRQLANSEPCHSCKCHLEKCMNEYGLRRVYYSD